ncbi:glycoside hydrolase family 97 protein [Phytoactinopolyspora endophytica]|uniref:glycoside hydrolase family 97 protein n=1 Tax=Phytoactinopolyspora endophytica TaxID=1642495 RepID=UPI00101D772C|nr:glycoside hydrolase family 97 protein [Phytoactinopolyspora endophytica]
MTDGPWLIAAPSADLAAELRLDDSSGLTLRITRAGRNVVAVHQPAERIAITGQRDREVDESYTTTTGKRREHRHRAAEVTFTLDVGGSEMELDVRAADTGVAYRYRLPGAGTSAVLADKAEFVFAPGARAWLSPYQNNNEGPWRGGLGVGELAPGTEYGLPLLVDAGDDTWCLLAEAGVDETHAAAHLVSGQDGRFQLTLPQDSVPVALPWTSPWRVAVVGSLATVTESDLTADLNPPARVEDTSWIKPGRVAWSWWSQIYSPTDPDRQREYVDYAAKHSWEYTLVDARWDPAWLPDLVTYATERGVGILIWSHWTDLATQEQRDELLPRWKSWGVAGIKVDFMDSDTQDRMAWYEALAGDAAANRLMVNYHGSVVPKGRQRTWPHVMTYEGIRGAEHYVRYAAPDDGIHMSSLHAPGPVHNTIVPFTRNAVGSMDYTPVTFSHPRRETSDAHELALSVVFESGWQHFADSIESYAERPIVEEFLDTVPTVWDDTKLVTGRPGELVVMARRDGDRWFLGGIAAGLARRVTIDLDFLEAGGNYGLRLVEDAADDDLTVREETVSVGDSLTLDLVRDGGFAGVATKGSAK